MNIPLKRIYFLNEYERGEMVDLFNCESNKI